MVLENPSTVSMSEIWYGVGAATVRDAGTRKVTRRIVPITVAIAVAVVVAVGPAPVVTGAKVSVMLAGAVAAPGNPDPVTLTLVSPG